MAPVTRSDLQQLTDDESDEDNDDKSPLLENPYDKGRKEDLKGWDVFIVTPPEEADETAVSKAIDITLKLLKVFVYLVTFSVVIVSAVIAKGSFLFMTSQIKEAKTLPVCRRGLG